MKMLKYKEPSWIVYRIRIITVLIISFLIITLTTLVSESSAKSDFIFLFFIYNLFLLVLFWITEPRGKIKRKMTKKRG